MARAPEGGLSRAELDVGLPLTAVRKRTYSPFFMDIEQLGCVWKLHSARRADLFFA